MEFDEFVNNRCAAELHMVHKTYDNTSFSVVAVLYKYGPADPLLAKVPSVYYFYFAYEFSPHGSISKANDSLFVFCLFKHILESITFGKLHDYSGTK